MVFANKIWSLLITCFFSAFSIGSFRDKAFQEFGLTFVLADVFEWPVVKDCSKGKSNMKFSFFVTRLCCLDGKAQ